MVKKHKTNTIQVGSTYLYCRNKKWWIYYRLEGEQIRYSLKCTNRKIAIEKALEISNRIERGEVVDMQAERIKKNTTVNEFLEKFFEIHNGWSTETTRKNQGLLNHWTAWEKTGSRRLVAIRPEDIVHYLAYWRKRGNKDSSVNRKLACLKTVFRRASEWGYVDTSCTDKVQQTKEVLAVPNALTDEEFRALMDNVPETTQQICTILVETGLRWGELVALEWSHIDLKKRELLVVRSGRSTDFRVIPLTQTAINVFKDVRQQGRIPFVANVKSIRKGLQAAAVRAKIKHVYPHMFRHTFATRCRDAGVPIDRIKELLGHRTMTMTLRYAQARPVQLREAISLLESRS